MDRLHIGVVRAQPVAPGLQFIGARWEEGKGDARLDVLSPIDGRILTTIASGTAGVVDINTYGGADITVPLGGYCQSGNGHDKSLHALEKYTSLKTAWIQL